MTIRPARTADLHAVVAIYNQAVRAGFQTGDLSPVTAASRQAWFDAHGPGTYPLWVADVEGRPAGWCSLSEYRPGRGAFRHTAEISYYVGEGYRRRGIGTALVRHAVAAAPGLGFRILVALLLDANAPSRLLLERDGFAEWGRVPGAARFGDTACDHLIYGRHVAPG